MAGLKVNLTVIEGPEKGKAFSFDEPENFLLGRGEEGSKVSFPLVGNLVASLHEESLRPSEERLQSDKSGSRNNAHISNINEIADSLVAEANNRGGRDNISLILGVI